MIFFILLLTVLFFILLTYMANQAKELQITEEVLYVDNITKEISFLFISDVHRREIKKEILQRLPPVDFVVIGGDLVERGVKDDLVNNNITSIQTLGQVFFIWGNNDYEFGEHKLRQILFQRGITLLENESYLFKEENVLWSLVGVEDVTSLRSDLQRAMSYAEGPCILISHDPNIIKEMEHSQNIIAILSGHTHGGQIRIGPIGIAEKGGWKQKRNIPVFISNGFGTRKLPLRLGAVPQIHIFKIIGKRTN
ncbi:metallophosphoesterase [Evansella sp. AB-rgal1]|uniref:metallophosphoesterase n=1 Tax=Evansella sp. AB-rgal1 TaxID=3242696 RepID=UPI00359CFDF6